jgi:hypothetical protein
LQEKYPEEMQQIPRTYRAQAQEIMNHPEANKIEAIICNFQH